MNDHAELISFVLEGVEGLPIPRRVKILRGLASVCGDEQEEEALHALAEGLLEQDGLCAEFKFSFMQKNR